MTATIISKDISAAFIFQFCLQNQLQICVYSLPDENYFEILVSENITEIKDTHELFEKKGFVISPFSYNETTNIDLIEAQYRYIFDTNNPHKPYKIVSPIDFDKYEPKTTFQLKEFDNTNNKTNFKKSVSNIIDEIKKNNVKKVVLAQEKTQNKDINFNAFSSFLKLCKHYPTAFNSLIFSTKYGLWIGSSPEILIAINENNIFKTVALAGTKAINNKNTTTTDAQWTQKEIQEQALVARYIVACFKKIRVREYEENGPKTIQAGPLWHLKSEFSVNLSTLNFDNLPAVMLQLLNPTSAVAGMPKNIALELIQKNENFVRKLYSGYIGIVNIGGINNFKSNIYVNLRCAEISNTEIKFYAGAGITEDSDPDAETDEIANKMQVLASILNQNS